MGASIKRDIHKRDRAADAAYTFTDADSTASYTPDGIERLLRDVYAICERETYAGDLSATVIRLDLENSLRSRCLTPRQRQVVALYYFGEVDNEEDVAAVLGISQQAVNTRKKDAQDAIAAHMSGESVKKSQYFPDEFAESGALYDWLDAAAMCEERWWDVTDAVRRELNRRFPPVDVVSQETPAGDPYRILSDGEMFYRGKQREVSCAEIYPQFYYSGFVRSPEDGRKVRLPRTS